MGQHHRAGPDNACGIVDVDENWARGLGQGAADAGIALMCGRLRRILDTMRKSSCV